jgi:hypothetical protein
MLRRASTSRHVLGAQVSNGPFRSPALALGQPLRSTFSRAAMWLFVQSSSMCQSGFPGGWLLGSFDKGDCLPSPLLSHVGPSASYRPRCLDKTQGTDAVGSRTIGYRTRDKRSGILQWGRALLHTSIGGQELSLHSLLGGTFRNQLRWLKPSSPNTRSERRVGPLSRTDVLAIFFGSSCTVYPSQWVIAREYPDNR